MHFLKQANKTCELMWSIYRKCVLCLCISMLVIPINSILLCRIIDGNFIVEHFFRPVKTMLVLFIGFVPMNHVFNIFLRLSDYHGISRPFWATLANKC